MEKKAADDFDKQTLKTLRILSSNPFMFKEVEGLSNLRRGLVRKISSFYYEVKDNRTEVAYFWGNRQKPIL